MAAKKTARKRRVKKHVESGVAHIHSTFNNTFVSLHHLLLKWPQKQLQNLQWIKA